MAFLSCRRFSDFGYRERLTVQVSERFRVDENILLSGWFKFGDGPQDPLQVSWSMARVRRW